MNTVSPETKLIAKAQRKLSPKKDEFMPMPNLQITVKHPLTDCLISFDMSKAGERAELQQLYPRGRFMALSVPTLDNKECDFEYGQTIVSVRKNAGDVAKILMSEVEKLAAIAKIEIDLKAEIAALEEAKTKAQNALQIAMNEAMADGSGASPEFMERLPVLSKPLHDANEAIDTAKKTATAKIESIKTGKVKTGTAGQRGNGNRTNELPKIEGCNCFIRKSNGSSVLALRGSAIRDYEAMGLSDNWQGFTICNDGENKGFWEYWGTLGSPTSNSALNALINKDVLGNGGTHNSIGVNGLSAPNPEQVELIRTTQLRGLPEPK